MADISINMRQEALYEIENIVAKSFRRPFVPVIIFNQKIKGLYDTGADVSCLDEKIFREIPVHLRPKKILEQRKNSFKSATGNELVVKGRYLIPIQIGDRKLKHEIFVVKNLSEKFILGIDFILTHQLNYNTETRTFDWGKPTNWSTGRIKTRKIEKLDELSITVIKAKIETSNGFVPQPGSVCLVNIASRDSPGLIGGPVMAQVDQDGLIQIPVTWCAPFSKELTRGEEIGFIENLEDCECRELNPKFISAVRHQEIKRHLQSPISPTKKKFILDTAKLDDIPEKYRSQYRDLLLKYHEAISQHKFDLGRTETLMHEISLKTDEPVYVKQFKIPDAHRAEVEKHVAEWLKLGVVQPCRSKYNSPLFVVMKKNGGVRLVQDFRALNAQTHLDKYSMKDVSECISDIGKAGSSIFTAIDLTAGFWQMLLHPRSRPYTAFTLPGQGQFQWVTSPMGLLGSPSSFQRLMETVMHKINNVLVYIDDLLLHTHTHEEHLKVFEEVLQRLVQHGIKLNLEKCIFGSKEVSYLGFKLTPQGILPGTDKLKAVAKALPPASVKEVRQFLGLCNFFRNHVKNFAQISAPLVEMVKKECKWKGGPLPEPALKAFRELQSYLCSEPIVDYPRRDRAYALITDASLGDEHKAGGLGAILAQIDKKGNFYVIAYASRGLQAHEKNYSAFLLEMAASLWGMDHFETYLRGRHFTLFTDHRPLEKLGKVHNKTLNRLQEAMNQFDFDIIYKKGSEMPADFLSRNVVASINLTNQQLIQQQDDDPFIRPIKNYLLNRTLPSDPQQNTLVKRLAMDCFIEDQLVWRRIKRSYEPSKVVLLLPAALKSQVLQQAHGTLMAGHDGVLKTKERILSCYYWNGMDKDIEEFIKQCHKCQIRKPATLHSPALLTPLPQGTEPNQRIHADLFGPLRTSDSNKKYILALTDGFTKYVELVALENKEAATVGTAIFEKWFCRYGIPATIITDQGKEFCARLTEELFTKLGTLHTTTTPHHPQCNSQAEVANKTIAKYLASFVDDSTLDWEKYLAPLMFSYNTSFHRSIKTTPFFLTHGIEPRQPGFPETDLRRKFYGENNTDELINRLKLAREVARYHNEEATQMAESYYNKHAEPHPFKIGQLVLLNETYFLHKNTKLAPKWTGPHRILAFKGPNNAEILLAHNNKKLVVHTNRLKIYNLGNCQDFEYPNFALSNKKEAVNNQEEMQNLPTQQMDNSNFFDYDRFLDSDVGRSPPLRLTETPPTVGKPSLAQQRYDELPPQDKRPSNILVRLGPHPPSPSVQKEGGVQKIEQVLSLVDAIDEVDDDDDNDGWILVTRRKKRRATTNKQAAKLKRAHSGALFERPDSFISWQSTSDDEEDQNNPVPQQQLQPQQQQQPPLPQQQQQQPQQVHQPGPVPGAGPAPQPQHQAPPQPQGALPGVPGPGPAQVAGHRTRVGKAQPRTVPRPTVGTSVIPGQSGQPGQLEDAGQPRTGRTLLSAHGSRKAESPLRSGDARFQPYYKSNQTGESQILYRLHSPVPKPKATVLPGVPGPLSPSHVPLPEESFSPKSESGTEDQPVLISPNRPLWKQGWSGDASLAGATPKIRRSTAADSSSESTSASPPIPAHRRRASSEQAIYENINPFAALRGDLDQGGAAFGGPTVVNDPQPSVPRPILKKTAETSKVKKSVQYTPSTKGPRPVVHKRPPTPDLEVTIRPTSTLDIVDEILAGQPSKRVDGRTIPDTLIQINEPTPFDKAKKAKRQPEPSDRVLRDRQAKK